MGFHLSILFGYWVRIWEGAVSQGIGTQPANALILSPREIWETIISKLILLNIMTTQNDHVTCKPCFGQYLCLFHLI